MSVKNFDLTKTIESLANARQKVDKLKAVYKKNFIKADDMGEMGDSEKEMECCPKDEYLYWMTEYLYSYISQVEQFMYHYVSYHSDGHLPPIQGADKMETALNKLGIGGDYEVRKPVIYASQTETKTDKFGKLSVLI